MLDLPAVFCFFKGGCWSSSLSLSPFSCSTLIMRGLICGPKCAACGIVLSTWGVIMLPWFTCVPLLSQAMLGIFFSVHSATLIEDVPAPNDIHQEDYPQRIYELYNKVGYNCFIAAAVYVLVGAFSCCQMRLNQQKVSLSLVSNQ
uniref:Ribonuclease, RNase K a n=1 Tax=Seriola dumerili TaxID=41447 RepID=A0A3B4TP65_SERDU